MLIYKASRSRFDEDVRSGKIADIIERGFAQNGISHSSESEHRSWRNSLPFMQRVMDDPRFSGDIQIAAEFRIPQTSKRVDFIIAGEDENGGSHLMIVELKQWSSAQRTQRANIVKAYTGGEVRDVPHPSYQAYSYARMIEGHNEVVRERGIGLHPCAYLHNSAPAELSQIRCDHYGEVLEAAPVFISGEEEQLRSFILEHVSRPPRGDLISDIEHSAIRPSASLQDAIGQMLRGNECFVMLDEQRLVYETVLRTVEMALNNGRKYTIIIKGGPGTGKSVVAVRLLAELISRGRNAQYVTKNAAPRNVYFETLRRGDYMNGYVSELFRSSGSYTNARPESFDCLIVDEAHRLAGTNGYGGGNQIMEIIRASKVNVFFIDEGQIVTTKDIGTTASITAWARSLGSAVYDNESTVLTSQFRCSGSDCYMAFIEDVLRIRQSEDCGSFGSFAGEIELRIFDDPNEMREALRAKDRPEAPARMVAGYCYRWASKGRERSGVPDIRLENGFEAQWNFSSTKTWAIDRDSFGQVGCIHTCQGLEFGYVGVIIGPDLVYRDGRVQTDISQRAEDDFSISGLDRRTYSELGDRIIRNTYRVLLTRGQKGCYVYCQDRALGRYLRQRAEAAMRES